MQFARGGYMIYNKLKNFPFPEKWPIISAIYIIHRYTIHQTLQRIKMLERICICGGCFNLIIETSTINSLFVGKTQRTPKKFWTETTTYSLIIFYKQTTIIITFKSTCWNLKLCKYKYILSLVLINVLREMTDIMEARKN